MTGGGALGGVRARRLAIDAIPLVKHSIGNAPYRANQSDRLIRVAS